MSTLFIGEPFTFTQPDGTALHVRGWGDQHHAVFEALNGYTVVENPATGFYEYATLDSNGDELLPTGARPRNIRPETLGIAANLRPSRATAKAKAMENTGLPPGTSRWEARRKSHRAALRTSLAAAGIAPAPPSRATVGDFVGLCLLIDFPDIPATIQPGEVDDFCNKTGYTGYGNNGSVYDYFFEVSGGRLRYRNLVTPYYTAQHPRSYYTNEKVDQPIRARQLIKEALDHFKSQHFDFSSLTSDDQDYVYATNVFYSGTRVNNWSKGLWPHSFHLLTPYGLAAGKNAFDYQITDMTTELSLGTFCHENGHMICDFPDLYDYGYESAGIGAFCLMCAGDSMSKKNPTQVNAYLKYKAGWADSMSRLIDGNTEISSVGNHFYFHRRNAVEYFIIENRQAANRDKALPASGLAVWHVDEVGSNNNEQMTASLHYECALLQADGRHDLEDDSNLGDETDLFRKDVNDRIGRDTQPNSDWWDGQPSSLEISEISSAGVTMSFRAIINP